jgi:hypothetical protein
METQGSEPVLSLVKDRSRRVEGEGCVAKSSNRQVSLNCCRIRGGWGIGPHVQNGRVIVDTGGDMQSVLPILCRHAFAIMNKSGLFILGRFLRVLQGDGSSRGLIVESEGV